MTMKFTMRKIYHSTKKEASYRILADLKVDTVSADGVDTTLMGTVIMIDSLIDGVEDDDKMMDWCLNNVA